ncbi:MAG: putative lipid II flippase FtsW [Bdellovibrionota bacterium]
MKISVTAKLENSQLLSDRTLWIAIFALLAAGLVMVYSSSFIFALERYKDGLYFFKRHLIFGSIGVGAFIIGLKIPLKKLQQLSFAFVAATAVLLVCALIPGLSHRAGGASRWINLFGFTLQPAEIAKFAVILFVANQLAKKSETQANFTTGFLTYFIPVIPIYLLLLTQPDFGTFALLICATFCMLFGAGIKLRYLLTTVALAVPLAVALIFTSPYRKARVLGFLDPWSDPAHKGFQVIQSFLAFYSGKWLGVGLGNSKEKLFYLPEAHNDFIFAVVGEELGLFGVLFFVSLFLIVVMRGLTVAKKAQDTFQRSLAIGISTLIGLQAFFNMAVVLGLLPTKGLPLPLISYGGTSLITTLFILGVLTQLSERSEQSA